VDPGQAFVELRRRRHLAHHEAEVIADPRRQRVGGEAESDAVGGLGEGHWRERQQQVAVLRRCLLGEQLDEFVEAVRAAARIFRDHVLSLGIVSDATPGLPCRKPRSGLVLPARIPAVHSQESSGST
jgi:DNA-binding MurR/RpiR family transcriptional regulator